MARSILGEFNRMVKSCATFLNFDINDNNISPLLPRSEHERHSPNCPFVKGEHTQNVPLSVTLATSPAQFPNSPDSSDKIACCGFGSCPQFLAAATKRGKVCIWDVSKMMKVRAANCKLLRHVILQVFHFVRKLMCVLTPN